MRVFMDCEFAAQAADELDCTLAPENSADAWIYWSVPKHIKSPERTIVVLSVPVYQAEQTAESLTYQGVPAENIIITGMSETFFQQVAPLLREIIKTFPQPARTIAFWSPKGGVGKTTLAASLAEHYHSLGEKTVLLDTSPIPNAGFHFQSRAGNISDIDSLAEYQRIVIDTGQGFDAFQKTDALVLVVGPDTVQCVDQARRMLSLYKSQLRAVVYNRQRPEVPETVIKSAFPGVPLIIIDEDFTNCMSALASKVPASQRSQKIAAATGRLADILDGRG